MITGIVIENFKSIRERVEIELRPITLLFGANGAGKSTIVEALELIEQLLLDRHHRRGKSLTRRIEERVGAVRDATFGQLAGSITLGVKIASEESWFDYFGDVVVYENGFDSETPDLANCKVPDMASCSLGGDDATSLSLELTFGEAFGRYDGSLSAITQITRLSIGINDRVLLQLERNGDRTDSMEKIEWRVDTDHPVLNDAITRMGERTFHVWSPQIIPLDNEPPILVGFCDDLDDGPLAVSLNLAVSATLRAIEDELGRYRRIGPLREIPSRHFRPEPHPTREDWLRGLAAWDQLGFLADDVLIDINDWLGPENLDTGIEIIRRAMIPLDEVPALWNLKETDPNQLAMRLALLQSSSHREICLRPIGTKYGGLSETLALLSPSQVGTGVSQIIPVVVSLMTRQHLMIAISQPELHLHPRLQVKLADLFIHCVTEQEDHDTPNRVIVETHSEHLILRLLRRVRETTKKCVPSGFDISSDDIVIYHVSQENGQSKIRKLEVDAEGHFVTPWPDDFFEIDFYERFNDAQ